MDNLDAWMKRITGSGKPDSSKDSSDKGPKKSNSRSSSNSKKKSSSNSRSSSRSTSRPKSRGNSKNNSGGNKGRKPGQRRTMPTAAYKPKPPLKGQLKIIPLGGLNEVGKNMTVLEYEDDIIIIDVGFEFPGEELPGIDYIVPDVSYLEANKSRIRGIYLTHGHLDHIGGLPYILPKLNFPPVYGTPLTLGLVEDRVKEFKQQNQAKLIKINPDEPVKAGVFKLNFIRIMHSIPGCLCMVIDTPVGKVMHTGDFKFDDNPARNMEPADIHKLEKLKDQNILALLCESTNSTKPGHTISEQQVGEALEDVVRSAPNRIIVSSFASQIGRLQQIIDAAVKTDRTVFVSGRSMVKNLSTAAKLGSLKASKERIFDIKKYDPKKHKDQKTLILTTGSQGEPVAALARIARGEHNQIKAKKGDTIVFSSSPIIGNEHAILKLVNAFSMLGCDIVDNKMADIHTSGHGKQDELARMINYVQPKFLIPIHGEYYMRKALVKLAGERCNIKEEQTIMLQNGHVALATSDKVIKSNEDLEVKDVLIDGHGEGTVDSQIIWDRQRMSENGVVIAIVNVSKKGRSIKGRPDILTRGLTYDHEAKEIAHELSSITADAYRKMHKTNPKADRRDYKKYLRQSIDRYLRKHLDRNPMVIPIINES